MNRRAGIYCCLALLLLATSPSYGQHMNRKDSPCAAVASTASLVGCLEKARASADAKLNGLYTDVLRTLDGRADDAERLRNAERSWVRYRDANCEAEYDLYAGGSGGPPARLACIEAMTSARTKEPQIVYGWILKKFHSRPSTLPNH